MEKVILSLSCTKNIYGSGYEPSLGGQTNGPLVSPGASVVLEQTFSIGSKQVPYGQLCIMFNLKSIHIFRNEPQE